MEREDVLINRGKGTWRGWRDEDDLIYSFSFFSFEAPFHDPVDTKDDDEEEKFAAELRTMRWKIHQNIQENLSTSDLLHKYEEFVQEFISTFQNSQLSPWEKKVEN